MEPDSQEIKLESKCVLSHCMFEMEYVMLVLWFFFLFFLSLMDLLFLHLHMDITSHSHPCDSSYL